LGAQPRGGGALLKIRKDATWRSATDAENVEIAYQITSPHDPTLRNVCVCLLQKPLDGGIDYCKRKVNQMADNLKEIQKVRACIPAFL